MGIKRVVDTSFWTDSKVENFTPEDRYFMLYLLTGPYTTQLGIYEISIRRVAFELGYSDDVVKALIERFENIHGIIIYSKETNEIAVKNFLRHSIIKGGAPVRDCLIKELKAVKNKELIARVFAHIKGYEGLNATVKKIIEEYEAKNGLLAYSNESKRDNETENENENDNDNENDNENDVSYPDTLNESLSAAEAARKSFQLIIDAWNSLGLSKITHIIPGTEWNDLLTDRIREYGADAVLEAIEKIKASDFLQGGGENGWTINFGWFLKPDNFPKVLAGNYSNRFGGKRTEPVPSWMNKDEESPIQRASREMQKVLERIKGENNAEPVNDNLSERVAALKERIGGGGMYGG